MRYRRVYIDKVTTHRETKISGIGKKLMLADNPLLIDSSILGFSRVRVGSLDKDYLISLGFFDVLKSVK